MTKVSLQIMALLIIGMTVTACSSANIKKKIDKGSPIKVAILPFKITAPIKDLDDITSRKAGAEENEKHLLQEEIQKISDKCQTLIKSQLEKENDFEIVDVSSLNPSLSKNGEISREEVDRIMKQSNADVIISGNIPWYGKTNPWYPFFWIVGDTLVEGAIIGLATNWNTTLILANVGFNALTSIPIWYGGYYLFGLAVNPVTINANVYFSNKEKDFRTSAESYFARKELKKFSKKDRKKKEIQLETTLSKAAKELSNEFRGK